MPLRTYHLPNEDEFELQEIQPVTPVPYREIRQIAISRRQSDTCEEVAQILSRLGCVEYAADLMDITFSYRLGPLA